MVEEDGWVRPKAVEAADPNFQGSRVLPFPLLCTSLFLFLSPSRGRGNLTLAPHKFFIHGLSPFINVVKKLRSNSGNHTIGTIYPEMDKQWRSRGYLFNAVDTVLYPQHNSPTQHSSVLNLGTVLQGLTAIGLYLLLPQ